MKHTLELSKTEVIQLASKLIKNAKNSIYMTMNMAEEISKPLPRAYHQLLNKKVKKGIAVVRLGFGSRKYFDLLKRGYPQEENFVFSRIPDIQKYKRMLLIDGKNLLFSKVIHGQRRFFFSQHEYLIRAYSVYFKKFPAGRSETSRRALR